MRRGHLLLAAVAALTVQPTNGYGAGLPEAPVPVPKVEPPSVELPPVQLPAPGPLPTQPPSIPVPSVEVPALPAPAEIIPTPDGSPAGLPTLGLAAPDAPGDSGSSLFSAATPEGRVLGPSAPAGGSTGDGATRREAMRGRASRLPRTDRGRRALTRALSGCLDDIRPRRARLLVLRYGLGPRNPHPAREVARMLDVSLDGYRAIRRRALRELVREARRSSCESESGSAAVTVVSGRAAIANFGGRGSFGPAAGEAQDRVAVLGESATGREDPPATEERAAGVAPKAVADGGAFPLLLLGLAVLMLGSMLWFLVVRPARAAAERRRAYRSYFPGKRR